jgi:anaerobic selenocysteine-containing dehydrogenase
VALLPAATGNIGKPGAGFYYLNGSGRKGIDGDYVDAGKLRRVPSNSVSHMDLCATLENSDDARALFCWNINIATSNPDQARLRRALQRDDLLTVVVDLFQTDTADFADFVLPAASFLEFDDIVSSYFNLTLSAQSKVMDSAGDALPNQEIFRRLSAAMGFTEPELFESDESLLANLTRQAGIDGGFAALAQAGTVNLWKEPVLQFADLKFPTPSGKIEIACERAEADGHPRTPLPVIDDRPARGNLRLLSPASPWLMNSSYGNDPTIGERMGADLVVIHPNDARARNIGEGSAVRVANALGELRLTAKIDDMVPEGTALTWKTRWPKRQPGRANVNFLNPGRKADMGGSTAVHSIEVTVTPA